MNTAVLFIQPLVVQLGIILIAVRFFGKLAGKCGLPPMLGYLTTGIILGPHALGGIHLPFFPEGFFAGAFQFGENGLTTVNAGLFAFAAVGAVVLFFSYGLQTNIVLFLRYSFAGSVIGIGGAVLSFLLGDLAGIILLKLPFLSPQCLFLGIIAAATSEEVTVKILSDHKKADSPEGVTILAAAVFDDILGIIGLTGVLIFYSAITAERDGIFPAGVVIKDICVWFGTIALAMIFSKRIAGMLRMSKPVHDPPILALGIALILGGLFESQKLALIAGAFIAGISLSKTDVASVIQERLRGIYDFFVPVLFVLLGMMVNIRLILTPAILIFGLVYTLLIIAAKFLGCGIPALLIGFNIRGSARIGTGMIPRGELALIIAGIGVTMGILDQSLFCAVILMMFITAIAAAPLFNAALKTSGKGTRRQVKGDDSISASWDFSSRELTGLAARILAENLRREKFYIQAVNAELSQARKEDISLSVRENDKNLSIETARTDMPFAKNAVFAVINVLYNSVLKLRDSSDPKNAGTGLPLNTGTAEEDPLSLISPDCVSLTLKGETKNEIITELAQLLYARGKIQNYDLVLNDLFEREKIMSTGMQYGIALPHAKSDGIKNMAVAIGIKKEGVDFQAIDGSKSKIIIMMVSSRNASGPHIRFLSQISAILKDEKQREAVINSVTAQEAAGLLRGSKG